MNRGAGEYLRAEGLIVGWSAPVCGPLSLALGAGEVVGVVGGNGAGKSTLLAALVGEARIFAGTMQHPRSCRMVWQPQRLPDVEGVPLSGVDLIRVGGATTEALPGGLAACLTQRLDRLSGGQRQSLYLWACLARPAEVVLLDEPTNNLDAAGTVQLADTLRGVARSGRSVLLVSHDAAFVEATCDRTIQL